MSLPAVACAWVEGPPPTKISPLNKKRRFVPNSIPVSPSSGSTNGGFLGSFNSPVLLPVFGQRPAESDVQTQLFQVGMRIRKSVKDGYQTAPKPDLPLKYLNAGAGSTSTSPTQSWAAYATPERQSKYISSKKRSFSYGDGEGCDGDSDAADQSPVTPRFSGSDHRVAIPSEYFSINYDFDSMVDDDDSLTALEVSPSQKGVLKARVNGRNRKIALPRSRTQRSRTQRSKSAFTNRNLFEDLAGATQHSPPQHHFQRGQPMETICENSNEDDNTAASSSFGSLIAPCDVETKDFDEANFLQRKEDIEMDFS